jgi:DNA-binding NtrC family response regulator
MKSAARVVAATKRRLTDEVERGKFREDLYFRLAVVPITVPALRSRREDIPALVEQFLVAARAKDARAAGVSISRETMSALSAHDWPGNVRELRNVLDRALYLAAANGESELRLVDLPVSATAGPPQPGFDPVRSYREIRAAFEADFERRYVSWLLGRHDGNISAAAREAKMDRKYLYDLARKHGLRGAKG